MFGESYGTMRGAGLALALQNKDVDLNGVILLSDILNWDFVPDDPQVNPGIDMPYIVVAADLCGDGLVPPQGAATARRLQPFLAEVEAFATGDYATALLKGNDLPTAERQRIAAAAVGLHRPHRPLPPEVQSPHRIWRVPEGAAGRPGSDHRNARHALRRRDARSASKVASYDPQSAAISAAYVGAWNGYVRNCLHYGSGIEFKSGIPIYSKWDYKHAPPGTDTPLIALPNVLPDLAVAMKQNPDMKVMVNGGYFDVSTPYFEGVMEMRHLPVPPRATGQYRVSLL